MIRMPLQKDGAPYGKVKMDEKGAMLESGRPRRSLLQGAKRSDGGMCPGGGVGERRRRCPDWGVRQGDQGLSPGFWLGDRELEQIMQGQHHVWGMGK